MKSIALMIAGIIAILIFLFTIGPDLLIQFSLLMKKSSTANDLKKEELTYIAPPVLNSMNDATKSAEVIISGYAQDKQTIKLFVNGKIADKTTVKKNKQFTFSKVKLEKGNNEIKAKAVTQDDQESGYSQSITITYLADPPKLEISSPSDGQTIAKDQRLVTVRGTTDQNVKVTVNDFWAIMDEGNFSYQISLSDGENTLKIVATDFANNQTTKEIKVKIE